MDPFNSDPRPEEFPLGSPESRAAARLLVQKRNAALIPVMLVQISDMGAPMVLEHDPNLVGSDWPSWLTRQELETKQREYAKCEAAWFAQIERQRSCDSAEAPAVSSPDVASVPIREESTLDAASQGSGRKSGYEYGSEPEPSEVRVRRFIEERMRRRRVRGRRPFLRRDLKP
jgi:hypothetical protein